MQAFTRFFRFCILIVFVVYETELSSTAKPLYGPIDGGTEVTLTLENWSKQSSDISAVYFGDILKATDLQSDRLEEMTSTTVARVYYRAVP